MWPRRRWSEDIGFDEVKMEATGKDASRGEALSSGLPARRVSGCFFGGGGIQLHLQGWLPGVPGAVETEGVKAVLAVIHGYGDHGGRYAWFGDAMAAAGFAVYVYDLRGHGRSPGIRGQVRRFDDYLDDTELFLDEVRRRQPTRTPFLLGHSMGGLICVRLAQVRRPDVSGMILSAPFLHLAAEVSAAKLAAARLLAAVWPGRDIGNTVRAADLSRDAAVVQAYGADRLVHHVAPARWAVQTLAAQDAAMAGAERVALPLYLFYGTEDPVADPAFAEAFFTRARSGDKTRRPYPGMLHECLNEVGREHVYTGLMAWIAERPPD